MSCKSLGFQISLKNREPSICLFYLLLNWLFSRTYPQIRLESLLNIPNAPTRSWSCPATAWPCHRQRVSGYVNPQKDQGLRNIPLKSSQNRCLSFPFSRTHPHHLFHVLLSMICAYMCYIHPVWLSLYPDVCLRANFCRYCLQFWSICQSNF